MAQFTDNSGRAWSIVVNVGTVKRVRELCGVNLLDAGDPKSDTLNRLAEDAVLLIDVLWACVKPEAEKQGVSNDSFCDSIVGEPISYGAAALLEAIKDFFPQPRKGLMEKLIAKGKEVQAAQMRAAVTAGEEVDRLNANELLATLSTPSAGASPGVSVSTLTI